MAVVGAPEWPNTPPEISLIRRKDSYVAVSFSWRDLGQADWAWLETPIPSTVGSRGRRAKNFVPLEDVRALREMVRTGSFRLQAEDSQSEGAMQDYVSEIMWNDVLCQQ